jgi:four helix bundle protein
MDEKMSIYFDFEKLQVYQKSLDYIDFVYHITKDFPKDELFGLTNNFRRAA